MHSAGVGIDTFLKPVPLGRAADAPTLIILLSVVDGMTVSGLAGLLAGAVILVLAWEALEIWIKEDDTRATEPPQASEGAT